MSFSQLADVYFQGYFFFCLFRSGESSHEDGCIVSPESRRRRRDVCKPVQGFQSEQYFNCCTQINPRPISRKDARGNSHKCIFSKGILFSNDHFFVCLLLQELVRVVEDRDKEIQNLKEYIDTLLLRVMDTCPTVLQTPFKKNPSKNRPRFASAQKSNPKKSAQSAEEQTRYFLPWEEVLPL